MTSNKTKYLVVLKTLNPLTIKDYSLFLDKINDGSQNTFA